MTLGGVLGQRRPLVLMSSTHRFTNESIPSCEFAQIAQLPLKIRLPRTYA